MIQRLNPLLIGTGITYSQTATMPKGPRGESRPADVIGMSVKVMRIATGEEEETLPPVSPRRSAGEAWRAGSGAEPYL